MKSITNPLTGALWPAEGEPLRVKWSTLGCNATNVLADFDAKYKKNNAVVFKAGTGTGKGIIISPNVMLLENVKSKGVPRRVAVSEPRTTNCVGVAGALGKLYGKATVNYGVKNDNNLTPNTLLNFQTDGFLVNFFYNDPDLKDYTAVIVDEVHERNESIDQILAFCRICKKKLVLLSATIDVSFFVNYLKGGGLTVGSLELEGVATFPVEDIYLETTDDYVGQAVKLVDKIIKSGDPGDFIIFLSSQGECVKACKQLRGFNLNVVCYEFHRNSRDTLMDKITGENFKKDLVNGRVPDRKIIFATNVAESGITIDGLKFVIDSGRRYENRYSAEENLETLETRFISKAESDQRRGRVGRTSPGKNYRLFSKADWDSQFSEYKDPEILIKDIAQLTLKLLGSTYGGDDIRKVFTLYDNMPNPPPQKQRDFAIQKLQTLDLITADMKITKLGREAFASQGGNLELAIVMIRAVSYKIIYKMARILAMYETEPEIEKWFKAPHENQPNYKDFLAKKATWADSRGEIFIMRRILDKFMDLGDSDREAWCNKNYFHFNKLTAAKLDFHKKMGTMNRMMPIYEPPYGLDEYGLIIECFEAGFKNNIATFKDGVYEIDRPARFVKIEKPPLLKKLSKKVIYTKIAKINGKVSVSGLINLQ